MAVRDFYSIPDDICQGFTELGFVKSPTDLNFWDGEQGFRIWIRRYDSPTDLESTRMYDTLIDRPTKSDKTIWNRLTTGIMHPCQVVPRLSAHLDRAGYPVDAILRRRRLLALIAE